MGPLQVKIAFLNAIGDWLEGSGWLAIFERARMTTDRCIDSFISGSKIKRSRNAYQVSLAALIKLARLAFEAQNEYLNCSDWTRHHCSESATVSYWLTVIDLEVLFFMFIRSLREEKILSHGCFAWFTFIMLEGSQFSWWTLEKWAMKATTSWNSSIKGTLLSAKLIVLFQIWVLTKHMSQTTKLFKSMVELLAYYKMKQLCWSKQ